MFKKIGSALLVLSVFGLVLMASVTNAATTVITTGTTATDPCATLGTSAWAPPTATAPAGNVAAPINVSGSAQQKYGKLTVGSIPCPTPLVWTPVSSLTVNGITDTDGFSNWGSTFLQGLVSIGGTFTLPATSLDQVPKLYVLADTAVSTAHPRHQSAALFAGGVGIRGSLGIAQNDGNTVPTSMIGYNTIYVQGIPVCLQNGSNCPTSGTTTTTTTGPSGWTASGTSLYNTNTGTVMLGTTSNIYPSTKLFVSGTSRIGADVDYGTSPVLSVAPGTVNFDAPGVIGGRMSINGTTGVTSISKLRIDSTHGGDGIPIYRMNPLCVTSGVDYALGHYGTASAQSVVLAFEGALTLNSICIAEFDTTSGTATGPSIFTERPSPFTVDNTLVGYIVAPH